MQLSSTSSSYLGSDLQKLLGLLQSRQAGGAGQDLPGQAKGADPTAPPAGAPPPGPPPPGPPAPAPAQFAGDTLASLIGSQGGASSFLSKAASAIVGALDSNGDGELGLGEVTKALSAVGSGSSAADVSQAFSALDTNKDGVVSAEELAAGLQQALSGSGGAGQTATAQAGATAAGLSGAHGHRHHHHGGAEAASSTGAAASLVSALDQNGDGQVSLVEITDALTAPAAGGLTKASDSLTAAFGKLDANGDGKLSSDELSSAIQAYQARIQAQGIAAGATAPAGSGVSAAA